MTIDDRLRDYATRWNVASARADHTSDPVAAFENDTAVVVLPATEGRRRRAGAMVMAAGVAVLIGAAGVTATMIVHRDTSAPAVPVGRSLAAYPTGAVDEPTPAGQLIPTDQRVAAVQISGPLLTGGTWSLASQLGQVVVVSAWASWCVPCQQYAPSLGELVQPGVSVVGFAVKEANIATTRQFVESSNITYPVITDDNAKVIDDLAPPLDDAGVPMTFLIDRLGGIAAVYLGSTTRSGVNGAVAELLAE